MSILSKAGASGLALAFTLVLGFAVAGDSQAQTSTKGKKSQPQPTDKAAPKKPPAKAAKKRQRKVYIRSKHGDWAIRCEKIRLPEKIAKQIEKVQGKKLPAAKDGVVAFEQCTAVQAAKSPKMKKLELAMVVAKTTQGGKQVTVMQILAPLGVFLPTGAVIGVDGKGLARMEFRICSPIGCLAQAPMKTDIVAKFQKGSKANVVVYLGPGDSFGVPVSLKGFSKAYATLKH